jgi:hypothetical protein
VGCLKGARQQRPSAIQDRANPAVSRSCLVDLVYAVRLYCSSWPSRVLGQVLKSSSILLVLLCIDSLPPMATLLSLPLELIIYISSFIATPDLASLRLTCKQTEKSLYEWFVEEFFAKKQFMLTQPSLQTLVDISKHVSLSKRLKHVIIATNVFDDTANHFRDSEACDR